MPTIPPARTLSHRPAAFVARALMAVLASLTVLPAASTAAEPVQPFTVRFERFGIADGLSQSSVSAIARDARGFLWIGTREGLDRYDGYEFVTYRPIPDDPLSLTGGSVVAIATDAQGDLWIATTSGGVDRYDVENDVFEHHPLPDFGPGDGPGDLLALVASRTGTIWIGTSRGLLLLDPTSGKPAFEEVLAERVQALAEDRDGQMLVATGDGALLRLSTGGERVARWELGTPARALAVGAAGDIWAGLDSRDFVRVTSAGIEAFVLGADAAPGGARIRDIAFDRGGHLWLAGLGMGVVRFDPVSGSTRVERLRPLDPFSLSNNDAVSLLIDSDDRLWVGTLNGGLNRASLAPTGFAHYWHQPDQAQTLSHPAVTSFAAADDGVLWIGTDGGGLNRLDLRSGTFDVERANREAAGSIPDDRVWSLALDSRGALWVGTWGGGLATRSVDADAFASIDALPGRIVTSLRADHDSVWAGTADAGLAQLTLDGRLQRTFRHDPGDSRSLSADNVTVVHVDQRDRLWVGTWNAGLNRLDPDAPGFVRYRAGAMGTGGLPHDSVRGIAEQPDGTLWFATAGGVARLGPQARSFESVTAADGLPEGTIYAAVPDPQGHLWLTTNRGIVRYSPATGAVRVIGPGDGAQAYEFNGGASLALPDGRLA
ncbi:MAG TPA: two-component regulator propeller domain-containing protein, partial [Steroidobacteraceae bacterium]|nr:two-component regulator propeller domain-containing protein [Steroidobacteraceae bacterium]